MLHPAAEADLTLGPFDMAVRVRKPQYLSFSPNPQNAILRSCGPECNMHNETCYTPGLGRR